MNQRFIVRQLCLADEDDSGHGRIIPIMTSRETSSRTNRWLERSQINPNSRMRLFCFPYAGGGSSFYRSWSKDLPAFVDVCPIQLPGRETRLEEPPAIRLAPLAEAVARAILPYLDKPFAFFGHSLGALLGFEVARKLRDRNGHEPVHLFASAHGGPHIPGDDIHVYKLSDSEFVKHLQTLNGTPDEVLACPELMEILLPTLKADFELIGTYEYKPEAPLKCPITAFSGTQDHSVTPEAISGWQIHTTGTFSAEFLPGDHFYLLSHRTLLLRKLSEKLHGIARRLQLS